jgi:hypothetical protein
MTAGVNFLIEYSGLPFSDENYQVLVSKLLY